MEEKKYTCGDCKWLVPHCQVKQYPVYFKDVYECICVDGTYTYAFAQFKDTDARECPDRKFELKNKTLFDQDVKIDYIERKKKK